MNCSAPFTKFVIETGLLAGGDELLVVDVGASGGIGEQWRQFEPCLRAVAFDPLLNEIDRLNRLNTNPKIRYEAAFVGCKRFAELLPEEFLRDPRRSRSNQRFQATSAALATEILAMNYAKEVFNRGADMVFSERCVDLDDYFTPSQYQDIDFIKVDTDGHDYSVLMGGEQLLRTAGPLGLSVECQFQGPVHPHANVFSNIDRLLQSSGYTLFDLDVYQYSRANLPRPFLYDIPAQTIHGQTFWGEALYFRDLADPEYEAKWGQIVSWQKKLKLACLFEVFDLPDCAIELLQRNTPDSSTYLDLARSFDLLTPTILGRQLSYSEYQRHFEECVRKREFKRFGRTPPSGSARSDESVSTAKDSWLAVPVGNNEATRLRLGRQLDYEGPVSESEFLQADAMVANMLVADTAANASPSLIPALGPLLLLKCEEAQRLGDDASAQQLRALYVERVLSRDASP